MLCHLHNDDFRIGNQHNTQDSADYAKAAALPKNLNIFPMLEW